MNNEEMMFEIWMEDQIDRLDRKYMEDQISTEEYEKMKNELYNREEMFYTQLV